MAGAVPKRAITNDAARRVPQVRALDRAVALRWMLPALLLLATVLAISVAYQSRPFVAIDIGDYYDRAFLPNLSEKDGEPIDFYAREVNAIGAEQITPWPAAQETLDVPGHRQGLWQVTVEQTAALPDRALSGLTLSANGVRLWLPRSGPRQFIAIIPADIAAADTIELRLEPGLADDPAPPTGLVGQVRLAPARTYRWTSGASTIRLPGIGPGDWNVTLVASLSHPDNQPLQATVSANGVTVAQLPDGGLRRLSFVVPAALVTNGDLTLGLHANTFKDPRDLGVLLYEVSVAPAGAQPLAPPLLFLLYAAAITLGLYWCLLRMTTQPWLAATLALLVLLAGAWALAAARFPTAFMLPRLAVLALWSVLLLLLLERLIAWAFRSAGVPLSPWLLRGLLLVFFVGYWLKAGGMLYPYFVGIDMRKQLSWAQRIYNGDFWLFYGTDNPMNTETMPTSAWGTSKPVIPYSPWFHILIGSFSFLPLPAVLAAHMFSALIDTSRVFLLALLARKSRFSERESLFGALLLAVTPVTFLLHSWGNLPTTFALWCTLLSTVFIVVAYRRLNQPGPFAVLTLLLTITLLMYTVIAAFMGVFLVLLVLVLGVRGQGPGVRRGVASAPNSHLPSPAPVALASLAALGLAMLIYYGQYIPLILERTVPYFLGGSQAAQAGASVPAREPFLHYLLAYVPRTGYLQRPVTYGLQLALLLGALSLFDLGRRPLLRAVLICWALVAALFLVAGSRIDMVDKHIFYLVPALALLAGRWLSRLWQRGLPARLVVASVYLFTFVAALDLWVYRIMTIRQ